MAEFLKDYEEHFSTEDEVLPILGFNVCVHTAIYGGWAIDSNSREELDHSFADIMTLILIATVAKHTEEKVRVGDFITHPGDLAAVPYTWWGRFEEDSLVKLWNTDEFADADRFRDVNRINRSIWESLEPIRNYTDSLWKMFIVSRDIRNEAFIGEGAAWLGTMGEDAKKRAAPHGLRFFQAIEAVDKKWEAEHLISDIRESIEIMYCDELLQNLAVKIFNTIKSA